MIFYDDLAMLLHSTQTTKQRKQAWTEWILMKGHHLFPRLEELCA